MGHIHYCNTFLSEKTRMLTVNCLPCSGLPKMLAENWTMFPVFFLVIRNMFPSYEKTKGTLYWNSSKSLTLPVMKTELTLAVTWLAVT